MADSGGYENTNENPIEDEGAYSIGNKEDLATEIDDKCGQENDTTDITNKQSITTDGQENIEKNKVEEKKEEKEEKEKNKDINKIIPSQANNNCNNENKEQNQECAINNLPKFIEIIDLSKKNIDEIQKKEIEMKKKEEEERNNNTIKKIIMLIKKITVEMKMDINLENLLNGDIIQNIIRFFSKETNNLEKKENNNNINNAIPQFTIMLFYFRPIYVPAILFSPDNTENNNIENNNIENSNIENNNNNNNSIVYNNSTYHNTNGGNANDSNNFFNNENMNMMNNTQNENEENNDDSLNEEEFNNIQNIQTNHDRTKKK